MIGDQRRGPRDYDGRVTSGVESTPQNYLPFMRNRAEYVCTYVFHFRVLSTILYTE